MNNEGKDAALSREQVERYYAEVTSPDELGITDPRMKAVFDMALRAESLQAEVERLRADVLAGKILRDGLVNQCNDAERKLAEAVAALRKDAVSLWKLLDDIDTASDIFKTNYEGLAKYVYFTQRKRFEIMTDEQFDAARGAEGK